MTAFNKMCISFISMVALFIFAIIIPIMDKFLITFFIIAFICNFMGVVSNAMEVKKLLDNRK